MSISYVVKLTKAGRLKARKEGRHVWYDADSFEAFASTWKRQKARAGERKIREMPQRGPVAAEAFDLLAKGVDWRGLVVRLKIDPCLARDLVREYETTPEVERAEKQRERVAKDERVKEREHQRKKRIEDLKRHQENLVRLAKHVTIALPQGSAPEKARG